MKRALFIKTKNFGDAVVLTAAISALPKEYIVEIVCFEDCTDLYLGISSVDRVWPVTRGQRGLVAISEGIYLLRQLRKRQFDLLCQFSDDWRGAFLARLLRSRLSLAVGSGKRPGFWKRSFDIVVQRENARRHSADLDVDLLRRAKIFQGDTPSYIAPYSPDCRLELNRYLTEMGLVEGDYLVLHLTSRWRFKELPMDTSIKLIRALTERGNRVVLTGSSADTSTLYNIHTQVKSENVYMCLGRSLGTFSELLRSASAVIAIDSLAIHLASANQTPVIAIFGPSGELNWRPWRTPYRIVSQSDVYPCRPCGMDGCAGSKTSECLRTMPVDRILVALNELTPRGPRTS